MRTVCAAISGLICMFNIAQSQVVTLTEQQPRPLSVAVQNLPAHPASSSRATSVNPRVEPQLVSDCATCTTQACNCNHGPCRGQCHGHCHGSHGRCWMPHYWGSSAFYHMPAFGSSVRSTMLAQIEEGKAARLVLYRFDFGPGRLRVCCAFESLRPNSIAPPGTADWGVGKDLDHRTVSKQHGTRSSPTIPRNPRTWSPAWR